MRLNLWKVAALILITVGVQSCGDDPTPAPPKTAEEIATEALTGSGTQTWTTTGGGKVTKGGADVTSEYATFELTLISTSSKTYTSKNSDDLFDASGTWSFAGSNFDKITLSGSKPAATREMSFTQSGDNLKLVFSIPAPGARVNAVAGDYVFDLVKK
ncbi:hypothetical protein J0A67_12435 [Algoriphagus aestuariicola]|jgi:hypothetical protein|uniref:Lipocalin-like domain-containing protein n=1 Tax=Algoriphagus aestuariicola TaxID=1852016 RepID=A0ABS3BTK7_9BACT|nr:hypothetical protein [Algoriphagus aestuariicola]MBN7801675.1 hypothetical protein [Algoriphagus aestuariicola]